VLEVLVVFLEDVCEHREPLLETETGIREALLVQQSVVRMTLLLITDLSLGIHLFFIL